MWRRPARARMDYAGACGLPGAIRRERSAEPRKGGAVSAQKPDPTGVKILDGAIRVLADFGVKRATVELVAKYAGVSHMTIYRRWPSKSDLFTAAVLGEFTSLLDAAFDRTRNSGDSFADQTLAAFTDIVWEVQNHPVVLRELSSESGEQVPMLSSAVMQTSVPLVTERLRRLAAVGRGAPADVDAVADVFVRLAHSLVVVKPPGRALADRQESARYARECFGPYLTALDLTALAGPTASGAAAASVIDLDQRRSARRGAGRPRMHIAVASVLAVLALSVGLTVALSGNSRLPFITPADNPRSVEPAAPAAVPAAPAQGGAPVSAEPPPPGPPVVDAPAGSLVTAPPAAPTGVPQGSLPAAVTQIGAGRQPAAVVGSIGGGAVAVERPSPARPPQPARPGPGQTGTAVPPGPKPPPPPGPKPGPPPPKPGPPPGPAQAPQAPPPPPPPR